MYDVKLKKDKIVSVGCEWSLLVSTSGDNDINKAVEKCYNTLKGVSFSNGYYRPKFDFISSDYQNSVMNRYDFTNHWLYDTQDFVSEMKKLKDSQETAEITKKSNDDMVGSLKDEMKNIQSDYLTKIEGIRKEITDILSNE